MGSGMGDVVPAPAGKLKEWSLLFYGTAEHPYTALGGPQSRGRTLEVPASEMEPSRAAFLQSQVEVAEEEEEYAGKRRLSCHVIPPQNTWENANQGSHKA